MGIASLIEYLQYQIVLVSMALKRMELTSGERVKFRKPYVGHMSPLTMQVV